MIHCPVLPSPVQVCDALGLCNSAASRDLDVAVRRAVLESRQETEREEQAAQAAVVLAEQHVSEGDERPYCELCEYAIGEVDRMLEDKKDEEEIKRALDRICYMLT